MIVGFLMMFLVMGIPVILLVLLFAGGIGVLQYASHPNGANPTGPAVPTALQTQKPSDLKARVCAHCGAGLQPGWTYCPQCGAPVEGR